METLEQCSLNFSNNGGGNYYKIGSGKPIVLLHGFAETYEIWNPIIPSLAIKYKLIIPEIPGCGNDNVFQSTFSMESIATYVNDILIQENISQTILFGHSMGGYASMAFAEKYSDKLIGLSLVHSSASADTVEKKKVRDKAIEYIRKNGKDGFFKTLIPKLYGSLKEFTEEKMEHLKMASAYSSEQIIACYTAMKDRPDRKHVLKQLNFPIQFIGGKEDLSVAFNDLEYQAQLCRKSYLTLFECVGHSSMNEKPKNLLEAIIGFTDDTLQTI